MLKSNFLSPKTLRMMPRYREPEIMDNPALEADKHWEALDGLGNINRFSLSADILWPPIQAIAQQNQTIKLLDIATGGGDVPIRLWRQARRAKLDLQIEACDISQRAVDYARRKADMSGSSIRFFQLDALADDIPAGYDVITTSLFLHHLDRDQAVSLIRKMAVSCKRMVLVNDLVRSRAGLLLAFVGSRLLSKSPVVHNDGPASVRAAFTIDEMRSISNEAEMMDSVIASRWPCRFLLVWRKH